MSVVAPGGITTSFEYDVYGRRTALVDPSAGRTTYEYDKGGNIVKVTDANGQVATKEYDSYNRVVKSVSPELTTTYTYSTLNDLVGVSSDNGTSKAISYDGLGRITSWRENIVDGKWLQKDYSYSEGNVSAIKYTSQNGALATENYKYTNSYLTGVSLDNGKEVYRLRKENVFGQPTEISSGGLTRSYAYDNYGYPISRKAAKGSIVVQNFSYEIDPLTGNLVSRKDEMRNLTENFGYDDINRLTSYAGGTAEYDDKGNVLSRSDVGSFEYGQASKPYAMTGVNLSKNVIPTVGQDATYTSFNRLSNIEENDMKAQFVYNGDYDRVKMEVSRNGGVASSHYYIGDCYELQQTGSGSIERLYLAGDYYDSPMVYVKEGSSWKLCNVLRDNLGSITHVTDYDGNLLQELSYDVWGRLRNPATQVVYAYGEEPALCLGRGYTGHEHLADFGLINMNARLYDPATSRFLSPDPYVQTPEQSQNFNRYSYCMNNPLKYTDKNGKFFFLIDGLIDLISNPIKHGFNFSQYSFQRTYNSLKIDWGLFQGNFKQILSRFTWESIQTGIGYSYSQIKNAVNDISDVEYFDGATYLVRKIEPDKKGNGVTIGSFININTPKGTPRDEKGNFAPYKDDLFMHEYGHYLQSQDYGFGYLFSVGIPSLIYTRKYDGKNVTLISATL